MPTSDDDSVSAWRRLLWNQWALAVLVVAATVAGIWLVREAGVGRKLGTVEEFYQQADDVPDK